MKADELEELEAGQQLDVQEQYRAASQVYRFEVQLDGVRPRLFLTNKVDVEVLQAGDAAYFEVTLIDAWAWSPTSPLRTRGKVLIHTFDTVVIEDRKPS
jgi:hypothetical protein